MELLVVFETLTKVPIVLCCQLMNLDQFLIERFRLFSIFIDRQKFRIAVRCLFWIQTVELIELFLFGLASLRLELF